MTFLIICLLFTLTSKELWAYSGTNKEQLNLREALKNATAHLSTSVEVKIQSKERNTSHLNRKYPI
jgi:ribosomal protein L16/L10AE